MNALVVLLRKTPPDRNKAPCMLRNSDFFIKNKLTVHFSNTELQKTMFQSPRPGFVLLKGEPSKAHKSSNKNHTQCKKRPLKAQMTKQAKITKTRPQPEQVFNRRFFLANLEVVWQFSSFEGRFCEISFAFSPLGLLLSVCMSWMLLLMASLKNVTQKRAKLSVQNDC